MFKRIAVFAFAALTGLGAPAGAAVGCRPNKYYGGHINGKGEQAYVCALRPTDDCAVIYKGSCGGPEHCSFEPPTHRSRQTRARHPRPPIPSVRACGPMETVCLLRY